MTFQEMIAELAEGLSEASLARLNAYAAHLKLARAEVHAMVLAALKDGILPFRANEVDFSSWLFARMQMFPPKGTCIELDRDRESPTFGLPIVAKCSCGAVEVSLKGTLVTGIPAGGWPEFCNLTYTCLKCRKVKIASGRKAEEFVSYGEALKMRKVRDRIASAKKKTAVPAAEEPETIVVKGIKLDDEAGHYVAVRRNELATRGTRKGKKSKKKSQKPRHMTNDFRSRGQMAAEIKKSLKRNS